MKYGLLLLALILGGCAPSAMPNFYNGNYYMAGDKNCARVNVNYDNNTIKCYNSKGKYQGYRNPMTQQQLEMYRFNQSQAAADSRQRSSDLNQSTQPQKKYCNYMSDGSRYCW